MSKDGKVEQYPSAKHREGENLLEKAANGHAVELIGNAKHAGVYF